MRLTPEIKHSAELKQSFGDGKIEIYEAFDIETNQPVSYIKIGKRLFPRRQENNPESLPTFNGTEQDIADFLVDEPEMEMISKALRLHSIGEHALFLGPKGIGKTRTAQFLAYLLNVPCYKIPCSPNMNVKREFLWTYKNASVEGGLPGGQLGKLPRSMQEGAILCLDELPNMKQQDRNFLLGPTSSPNADGYPIPELSLDGIPGEDQSIKAARGWMIIGTGNYEAGEDDLHHLNDREQRRITTVALGKIPPGLIAKRVLHRIQKTRKTDIKPELLAVIANYFERAFMIVENEVLPTAKQIPAIKMDVTIVQKLTDAFLHLDSENLTSSEVQAEALDSLDLLVVNQFREETKVTVNGATHNSARKYLQDRFKALFLTDVVYADPVNTAVKTYSDKIKQILNLSNNIKLPDSVKDSLSSIDAAILQAKGATAMPLPPAPDLTPEAELVLNKFKQDYQASRLTLDFFELTAKAKTPMPSWEDIKTKLTPEVLERTKNLHELKLICVPTRDTQGKPIRFQELATTIDAAKEAGKTTSVHTGDDSYIWSEIADGTKVKYRKDNQVVSQAEYFATSPDWEVYIVEGATEMPRTDKLPEHLKAIFADFPKGPQNDDGTYQEATNQQKFDYMLGKYQELNIEGITYEIWAMLLMDYLRQGKVIDKNTYTCLLANALDISNAVPVANCHYDQPYFDSAYADDQDRDWRSRGTVRVI